MKKRYNDPEFEIIKLHLDRIMSGDPGENDVYIDVSDPQIPTQVIDPGE